MITAVRIDEEVERVVTVLKSRDSDSSETEEDGDTIIDEVEKVLTGLKSRDSDSSQTEEGVDIIVLERQYGQI